MFATTKVPATAFNKKLEIVAPVYALFLNNSKSISGPVFPSSYFTKTTIPIIVIANSNNEVILVQPSFDPCVIKIFNASIVITKIVKPV